MFSINRVGSVLPKMPTGVKFRGAAAAPDISQAAIPLEEKLEAPRIGVRVMARPYPTEYPVVTGRGYRAQATPRQTNLLIVSVDEKDQKKYSLPPFIHYSLNQEQFAHYQYWGYSGKTLPAEVHHVKGSRWEKAHNKVVLVSDRLPALSV